MNNSMHRDKWLYRMVVGILGLTVVSSIVGTIVALGSASIGGLAGLLAPSPMNR